MFNKSESLPKLFAHSLFFKERLERFTPVALYKRATMSDSFRLLMTKEPPWAICSGCSKQKSDGSDLLFLTIESLFRSQKTQTYERIPNPAGQENIAQNREVQYTVQWITVGCTSVKVNCYPLYSALYATLLEITMQLAVQWITVHCTGNNNSTYSG